MHTETKQKIYRLLCLLPYYFGIVTLITYLISDHYHMLTFDTIPPRPPGEPLTLTALIEMKRICMKLFFIHFIALLLYSVISFPINTILAINLFRTSKKRILILYLVYLIIPVYLLLFYPTLLPF
jgi:hypothetical protein